MSASLCAQQDFQQQLRYRIAVRLDDVHNALHGHEEITYINNSPARLESFPMHLWPNAYRDNSSALVRQQLQNNDLDLYFARKEERGFIDSLDFNVNGEKVSVKFHDAHPDICYLQLNRPLNPGDSLVIRTPFYVKLPDARFSRLGHSDQSYYISQWYPKPALLDREGWHEMPYLDQGEFYADFATFDVSITLPDNYLLAATGNRVNARDEEDYLSLRLRQTLERLQNGGFESGEEEIVPASSKLIKTIRFVQDSVHDFAWFADKRFYVMRQDFELPRSGRKVSAWAYFRAKNYETWKDAVNYLQESAIFYSHHLGDYPYEHVTAVDSDNEEGGGMEYPMITLVGQAIDAYELDNVITHEVGHNWFYGILASNERAHPFLDEGLNSFYELRYLRAKYPEEKLSRLEDLDSTNARFRLNKIPAWRSSEVSYIGTARSNGDQSLHLGAEKYSYTNYVSIVYGKGAVLMDYLLDYFGEGQLDSLMKIYYERYRFRHPQPLDLFTVLFGGDSIPAWFLQLYNSTASIDYRLGSVHRQNDGSHVLKVRNKGGISSPYNIYAYKEGKPVGLIWLQGHKGLRRVSFPSVDADEFRIDGLNRMPDLRRANNVRFTNGFRCRGLQLNLGTALNDPRKAQLNWLPAVAYNYYNGVMAGLTLHNYSHYERRFEFDVTPLYGFRSGTPAGNAHMNLNLYPDGFVDRVIIGSRVKHFGYDDVKTPAEKLRLYYTTVSPFISLRFRNNDARSDLVQGIWLSSTYISADSARWQKDGSVEIKPVASLISIIRYFIEENSGPTDTRFAFELEHAGGALKASFTFSQAIYVSKNNNFQYRLFAGRFFSGSPGQRAYYAFRASGHSGWQDYLFDGNFLGRNERTGMYGAQFLDIEGAMKVYTPLGQSPTWLAALNLRSPSAGRVPLRLFADVVLCDPASLLQDKILFDAGINLEIIPNVVDVFVPLVFSPDIRQVRLLNGAARWSVIRFTFNIHNLEPKSLIQSALSL